MISSKDWKFPMRQSGKMTQTCRGIVATLEANKTVAIMSPGGSRLKAFKMAIRSELKKRLPKARLWFIRDRKCNYMYRLQLRLPD